MWGRNLEVNNETPDQTKDRAKSDGMKNVRRNVKTQESGLDQSETGITDILVHVKREKNGTGQAM